MFSVWLIAGVTYVARSCDYDSDTKNYCEGTSSRALTLKACNCASKLCNTATLSAASSYIVMTLAAATGVVLLTATRRLI